MTYKDFLINTEWDDQPFCKGNPFFHGCLFKIIEFDSYRDLLNGTILISEHRKDGERYNSMSYGYFFHILKDPECWKNLDKFKELISLISMLNLMDYRNCNYDDFLKKYLNQEYKINK